MIDLLYIASPSFSGSTLLTLLLAAHPRIATVGELKGTSMGDVDAYSCSCGQPIRQCAFWRALQGALAARGVAFDVARFGTHFRFERAGALANRLLGARLRGKAAERGRRLALALVPGAGAEMRQILARNRALAETVCALRGADVVLDGSKDPVRLKYLAESGGWRPRVIHLVRDGRGFASSYMRIYECGMDTAAREWRATNLECEELLGRLPANAGLRLRYEDLCRDPPAALRRCFALAGLAEPPAAASGDVRAAVEHHIVGNAMRLKPEAKIELNEKWRATMAPADLAAFERIAGPLNRRFGYA